MERTTKYYFMKNKEWYYQDVDEGILKLTPEAPENAKKSYMGYLKDNEHDKKVMFGMITDEEDDKYEEMRAKELEEEEKWFEEDDTLNNLFGV